MFRTRLRLSRWAPLRGLSVCMLSSVASAPELWFITSCNDPAIQSIDKWLMKAPESTTQHRVNDVYDRLVPIWKRRCARCWCDHDLRLNGSLIWLNSGSHWSVLQYTGPANIPIIIRHCRSGGTQPSCWFVSGWVLATVSSLTSNNTPISRPVCGVAIMPATTPLVTQSIPALILALNEHLSASSVIRQSAVPTRTILDWGGPLNPVSNAMHILNT